MCVISELLALLTRILPLSVQIEHSLKLPGIVSKHCFSRELRRGVSNSDIMIPVPLSSFIDPDITFTETAWYSIETLF